MRGRDLATGLVILLFPLQCRHLDIAQDDAFRLYLGLQRPQPIPEIGQIVAQPDAAHTRG